MRRTGPILLSGYAKLPSNTAAQKLYDQLVVVATVDPETGVIMDADCSMATDMGRRFVADLMRGYDLNRGPELLTEALETRYYGHLKKALVTAVREIFQHYGELKSAR